MPENQAVAGVKLDSTPLLACSTCIFWQAEMHPDDPLRPQGYGTCEFDASPRIGDRTHGSDGCGAHVQANRLHKPEQEMK